MDECMDEIEESKNEGKPDTCTHPCSYLFNNAALFTSAMTPIQPEIMAALAWAPLIPPRPDVTNT